MTLLGTMALASAMLLLAITPGPGVFATIASALTSGFRRSSFVVMGIVIGDLIFLLFAIFGLSALAESLGDLFVLVRYVGGGYLIYIGYHIWTSKPETLEIQKIKDTSWSSSLLSGLAITLGNPKVILFYLGFLPTFINLNALTLSDIAIVATVVSVVLGGVMLGYAYMASRAKQILTNSHIKKMIHRVAGGIMISTGSILIAKT